MVSLLKMVLLFVLSIALLWSANVLMLAGVLLLSVAEKTLLPRILTSIGMEMVTVCNL